MNSMLNVDGNPIHRRRYQVYISVTCQAQLEKNSGNQNLVIGKSAKSTFKI